MHVQKERIVTSVFILTLIFLALIFFQSDGSITGFATYDKAKAGNVTDLNLTVEYFPWWVGFYGNMTGRQCSSATVDITKTIQVQPENLEITQCYNTEIYLTPSTAHMEDAVHPTLPSIDYMNSLEAATASLFDQYFELDNLSSFYDDVKAVNMFNASTLKVFEVGDHNITVLGKTLNAVNGSYDMGILKDPDNNIVLVFRPVSGGLTFNNMLADFQLMLPYPPTGPITYYAFQDVTDNCGFPTPPDVKLVQATPVHQWVLRNVSIKVHVRFYSNLTSVVTRLIWPDGHVQELQNISQHYADATLLQLEYEINATQLGNYTVEVIVEDDKCFSGYGSDTFRTFYTYVPEDEELEEGQPRPPPTYMCGDGVCQRDEDCDDCPVDCGTCPEEEEEKEECPICAICEDCDPEIIFADRDVAQSWLEYGINYMETHPDCLVLLDLLENSQDEFQNENYPETVLLIKSIIRGCEDILGAENEEEQPAPTLPFYKWLIPLLLFLILLLLGLLMFLYLTEAIVIESVVYNRTQKYFEVLLKNVSHKDVYADPEIVDLIIKYDKVTLGIDKGDEHRKAALTKRERRKLERQIQYKQYTHYRSIDRYQADKKATEDQFMKAGDEKMFYIPAVLDEEDFMRNPKIYSRAMYGELPQDLVKSVFREFKLIIKEDIPELIDFAFYDLTNKRFEIILKNTGKVRLFVEPEIVGIIIKGRKMTLGNARKLPKKTEIIDYMIQQAVQQESDRKTEVKQIVKGRKPEKFTDENTILDPGFEESFGIPAKLTKYDFMANPKVLVHTKYGQEPHRLDMSAFRELDFAVRERKIAPIAAIPGRKPKVSAVSPTPSRLPNLKNRKAGYKDPVIAEAKKHWFPGRKVEKRKK